MTEEVTLHQPQRAAALEASLVESPAVGADPVIDILIHWASEDLKIETWVERQVVPTHVLRVGEQVSFRMALPEGFHGAQALLFERDALGVTTLLSTYQLTVGDIRFRDTVEIPRSDAQPDGTGPTGSIRLSVLGESDLLAVILKSPRYRLDCAEVFRRTERDRPQGPARNLTATPVCAADLRALVRDLTGIAPEDWAIAHARLPILGVAAADIGGHAGGDQRASG